MRLLAAGAMLGPILALGACASGPGPIIYTGQATPPVANPGSSGSPSAPRYRPPPASRPPKGAVAGIIGADARRLAARFGEPRIDLAEGDARKLQFIGQSCVLDIFLYPASPSGEKLAAHVEARRRVDGERLDGADCAREVERAR